MVRIISGYFKHDRKTSKETVTGEASGDVTRPPENTEPGQSKVLLFSPVQGGKGDEAVDYPATGLNLFRHRPSILVYHNIGSSVEKGRLMKDSVREADFDKQMRLLKEKQFSVVPFDGLVSAIRMDERMPARTVAITFDDGYKSTCTKALPILRSYGFPACVFLATDFIGRNRSFPWLNGGCGEDTAPLNWEEVRVLHRDGVKVGSHTASHRFLPYVEGDGIEKELMDSREIIEERVGVRPSSVALPFSFPLSHWRWPSFKSRLILSLAKARYSSCCTLQRGNLPTGTEVLFLPRVCVMRDDSPSSFLSKALGLYGYTSLPQYVYQRWFKKYEE